MNLKITLQPCPSSSSSSASSSSKLQLRLRMQGDVLRERRENLAAWPVPGKEVGKKGELRGEVR